MIIHLYLILAILFSLGVKPAYSADEQVLKPRVPANQLAEVKGLVNKVPANEKLIEEAREIFFGKGACYTCHGEKGRGDGVAGASFNPRPRNFTDVEWQKARTDGEIFWAITNGTQYGMIPFENMLSAEERWMMVNFVREFGKSTDETKVGNK